MQDGVVNIIINIVNGIYTMCNTINSILNTRIQLGSYGYFSVMEVLFGGSLAVILAVKIVKWILL